MTRPSFRILVIDDYAATRTLAKQVLAMRGHLCEAVGTALAALRAVEWFKPDVAILEWSLRDGSGLGLAEQLRARTRVQGRSLVVAELSALDRPSDFCEDVDAYFTKPVCLQEIEQLCGSLLHRAAG